MVSVRVRGTGQFPGSGMRRISLGRTRVARLRPEDRPHFRATSERVEFRAAPPVPGRVPGAPRLAQAARILPGTIFLSKQKRPIDRTTLHLLMKKYGAAAQDIAIQTTLSSYLLDTTLNGILEPRPQKVIGLRGFISRYLGSVGSFSFSSLARLSTAVSSLSSRTSSSWVTARRPRCWAICCCVCKTFVSSFSVSNAICKCK